MRIPLGNFGEVAQAPQLARGPRAPGGVDAVGQAVERLGNTGMQLADNAMQVQAQRDAEVRRKAEDMARATAAADQLDYGLQVKTYQMDLQGKINRGEVPWQDADAVYGDAINKIPPPAPGALTPDMAVHFESGLKGIRENARLEIRQSAMAAQDAENKGLFGRVLDTLGKEAGMPGADVANLNAKAEAFAPLARKAGLSDAQIDKTLQDFKDNNWTQQANQRYAFAKNDTGQLDQLANDLTAKDGYYADKLDANKRNAVLSQVLTRKQMLQDRAGHAQDRRDARAERVIGQFDQQIASGVPLTPELMANWSDATRGTASEQDFNERVKSYDGTQKVLQLAPAQQQLAIQQREAELQTNGGTVQDKANLERLKNAVAANVKQMTDAPLLWNQARMGDAIQPLNVSTLADEASSGQLGQQLQDRASVIDTMRKRYGSQIPMTLLLPQEAAAMASMLGGATPKQQTELFGLLRNAVGDDTLYTSVMQQLAPDSPVRTEAGKFYLRQRSPMAANGPLSPDSTKSAYGDIALKLLQGERLLHPTGSDTRQDGKRVAFPIPGDKALMAEIANTVGDAFNGRPEEYQTAIQAVRAYYAASVNDTGDLSGELDGRVLSKAINAVIGEVADVHDRSVVPPWGMSSDDFEDRADTYVAARLKSAGLPDPGGVSLMNVKGHGDYFALVRGRQYVTGKDGQPLVIKIDGGMP